MRHRHALFIALSLVACFDVDGILEGRVPIALTVFADSSSISIPQGASRSLTASVTKVGDAEGPASISMGGLPAGVTYTMGTPTYVGAKTTATITIHAADDAAVSSTLVKLVGQHARATEIQRGLQLSVISPPTYSASVAKDTLTIARGGTAPLTVRFSRSNFATPVTLSLAGATGGISARFSPFASSGDSTSASVSVAADVAASAYALTFVATAPGLADRTAPFTLNVTTDALQLIALGNLTTPQAASASTDIIINRGAGVGAVTLLAENLPTGVSAVFDKNGTTDATANLTLAMGPTAGVGTYTATVRAQAAGFPDATTTVGLTVTPATVSVSVAPQTLTVFQGTSANAVLTLARTQYSGVVTVSVSGAPTGLIVVPQPTSTTGTSVGLTIATANTVPPATYDLSVRGTPAGLATSPTQATTLSVTVRAAPAGGNVLLDWSSCAAPAWVAAQDGTGPWTRITPAGGVAGFSVTSGKGAYTWAEGGNTLNVRFATQSALTAAPIIMCPAAITKSVSGLALHASATEQYAYQLGGGSGISTGANPNFTITGIRDGAHDLVVSGNTTFLGARAIFRRDINVANGSVLDPVDLSAPEGFALATRALTVNGATLGGDAVSSVTNYLTGTACDDNRLGTGALGIPATLQRDNDFHEIVVSSLGLSGARTSSLAFHTSINRTVTLQTVLGAPAITTITGVPYLALRVAQGVLPAVYNGSLTFTYSQGTRSMTMSASVGYAGTNPVLTMPDFSAVNGWLDAYAIPVAASGSWRIAVDGASVASRCAEGRTSVTSSRTGVF